MGKKTTNYSMFSPDVRGSEDAEFRLKLLIGKMQTAENLQKLARAVSLDCWEKEKTKPARMDFSRFEEKLNNVKKEFFSKSSEQK